MDFKIVIVLAFIVYLKVKETSSAPGLDLLGSNSDLLSLGNKYYVLNPEQTTNDDSDEESDEKPKKRKKSKKSKRKKSKSKSSKDSKPEAASPSPQNSNSTVKILFNINEEKDEEKASLKLCEIVGLLPHPSGDCSKYSQCDEKGSPRVDMNCSDSEQRFDPFDRKCMEKTQARPCKSCFDKSGERFRSPVVKNQYYECVVNFPKRYTCFGGMVYNNEEKRCTADGSTNVETSSSPGKLSRTHLLTNDTIIEEDDEEIVTVPSVKEKQEAPLGKAVKQVNNGSGKELGVILEEEEVLI